MVKNNTRYERLRTNNSAVKDIITLGRGGGQVVSVLTFYLDDPSLNTAELYNISINCCLKMKKT